ncbi:hypothetical protein TALC_01029 [Thermoplasmatales archaeon BRNA1]|nr:hypothetical protein TALC_01029 [Thermoplasmatales archaeon BRNA1]
MLRDLSASDVANEISMLRGSFKGTFLIVEGVTDCRLYQKFVEDGVNIIIAHSKDNVRRSVAECQKRGDRRIVGIVDKDIDGMLGKKRQPPVFETDLHDMESMIMCSRALDDVLAEYGNREDVEAFEKAHGSIRDAVARAASAVGALMYISYRRGMNLSFKDLDHEYFVNRRTLEADIPKMVTLVYSQSMGQMYPKAAIVDQIRSMLKDLDSPWDAVRGHDAVDILAIGLRNSFGSYNANRIREGELGGALRLAYSLQYFKKSELYASSDAYAREKSIGLWISRRVP